MKRLYKYLLLLLCSLHLVASAQLYNPAFHLASPAVPAPTDSIAIAYINALKSVGDTLPRVQQYAIDRFVRDIKGQSNPKYATTNIIGNFKAIWPWMGGNSAGHKWNLLNAVDADAAFRLTFVGSPTHSASGTQFNGINQYAQTHCAHNSATRAMGIYIQTNVDGSGCDIGGANTQPFAIFSRIFTNQFQATYAGQAISTNTDSRGFFCVSRTSGDSVRSYKNGVQAAVAASASEATFPDPVTIAAWINYPEVRYSTKTYSFAFVANTGLSQAQMLCLYNAVQELQKTLNRAK